MTGRTHDLAAFTAINLVIYSQPLPSFSLATAVSALSACFIGGLAPDLDQPTANLWRRLPLGQFWGSLIAPIMGRHRFISHSLLGAFIFGFLTKTILAWANTFILVDMTIVWNSFMVGYISHLIADSLTRDGVPWLFPIGIYFGIPPVKALRIKTGGFIEKYLVFPALLVFNGFLISSNYQLYLGLLKKLT